MQFFFEFDWRLKKSQIPQITNQYEVGRYIGMHRVLFIYGHEWVGTEYFLYASINHRVYWMWLSKGIYFLLRSMMGMNFCLNINRWYFRTYDLSSTTTDRKNYNHHSPLKGNETTEHLIVQRNPQYPSSCLLLTPWHDTKRI